MLPKKILPLLILGALTMLAPVAGCGEQTTGDTSTTPPATQTTKTYSTTPASTSELLKDASDAIKAGYPSGTGVHFNLDTTTNAGGQTSFYRSEGDIRFPASVNMTSNNYLSPQPVFVDSILADGRTYIRSAGGEWSSGTADPAPPDPHVIADYLDYTRSSSNLGRETLKDGRKTWHVQVDVDMALLAHRLIENNADPELARGYENLGSAVVSADYWLGVDDQLPYQLLVRYSNPDTGVTQEQKFVFSNWGETVAIEKPCENC